jgi:hypothetical protein
MWMDTSSRLDGASGFPGWSTERRDVDPLAVHFHMPVADELARGLAAGGKAQAIHDVVETGLERDEQVGALHAGLVADAIEEVAELALGKPVYPLHFLLLTRCLAYSDVLRPRPCVCWPCWPGG